MQTQIEQGRRKVSEPPLAHPFSNSKLWDRAFYQMQRTKVIINPGEGVIEMPSESRPPEIPAHVMGSDILNRVRLEAGVYHQHFYTTNQEAEYREWAREKIFVLKTHEELLEFMAANDLYDYVDDYYDYLQARQSELEEGESPGIIFQSLQSWAWFLIDYALPEMLPVVKIRADFFGCVELTWRLSPEQIDYDSDNCHYGERKGIIVLTFYPSSLNYISIMSGAYGVDRRRISLHGDVSHKKTKQIMDTFKERLLTP